MRFWMRVSLVWMLIPAGCCIPMAPTSPILPATMKPAVEIPNANGQRRTPVAYDSPNADQAPGMWADNGMLRVRARDGIMWFDVFHPKEKKWYACKNNMNLTTIVDGKLEVTESGKVQPHIEVISQGKSELQLLYKYRFKNGAKIDVTMTMRAGEPEVRYVAHQAKGSTELDSFIWHVTFGQHEAVQRLRWEGHLIDVAKLEKPFPGGRVKAQHVEMFDDIEPLDFRFDGDETPEADPANPEWMSRVLGLDQHVTWTKPLRDGDKFAFEARDQPWQEAWDMPEVTPWIEALWVIRKGFLEGDELIYRVENFWETGGDDTPEKNRKSKSNRTQSPN